jgi:putative toxin-antitoxin system antitoxin component (TIGR02293 family)
MSLTSGMVETGSLRKKFQTLDLSDEGKIVFSAHKGVKPAIFYSFAVFIKMSEKKLASLLHIHPRTMSNYRDQHKKLAPVEGEHLLKLIALFAKGEEIFGNIDEFNYWLQKPFWDSKDRPIDWLITPGGVDLVSDELDRLAHGYAV